MNSVDGLRIFWQNLWILNDQTKQYLSFNLLFFNSSDRKKNHQEDIEINGESIKQKKQDFPNTCKNNKPSNIKPNKKYGIRQKIGLALGPLLFIIIFIFPVTEEFTYSMKAVAASTAWIAIWWITEALPIPITSMLPLIFFPILGIVNFEVTAKSYANPNVFLFMGGFFLAAALQRWDLHRRLALKIINAIGTNPSKVILGFMIATAFLSMWISNTATAMMMLPIGSAVIIKFKSLVRDQKISPDTASIESSFGTALMLGIAYAASIGGVGTLIGSPPNAIFASVAETTLGIEITFTQWLLYGFPIAVIFTPIAWFCLTKIFPTNNTLNKLKDSREVIKKELASLGTMKKGEKMVTCVAIFIALSWISRSLFLDRFIDDLSDPLIAIFGTIILFILPVNLKKGIFLLNWESAVKIPWGILLLFGGGIAIASGFVETGLAEWMGNQLVNLKSVPVFIIILCVVTLISFLSNITSNTGITSMMMPVMIAMAMALVLDPLILMITAATAASFAFIMPVGTPPNAIVFGSGYITTAQMAKAGLLFTINSIIFLSLILYFWLPLVWNIIPRL